MVTLLPHESMASLACFRTPNGTLSLSIMLLVLIVEFPMTSIPLLLAVIKEMYVLQHWNFEINGRIKDGNGVKYWYTWSLSDLVERVKK